MKVLITGVLGQTGSYMVDYLLDKYKDISIFGMIRHYTKPDLTNIKDQINDKRFKVVFGDLTDEESINSLVREIQPDYFLNFAANSFVQVSWEAPKHVFDINTIGVLRCLEAIKNYCPTCRFYSSGSSEEFGDVDYMPQDENHPLKPRSPYGASKASARHLVKVYRESYGLYAIQGFLFNHESPRRAECFLTKKVISNIKRIKAELENGYPTPMEVGNIYAKRDWSHAIDFCDGIWRMMNQDIYRKDLDIIREWNDYVEKTRLNSEEDLTREYIKFLSKSVKEYILSSGETYEVKEFIEKSFYLSGVYGIWINSGLSEVFGYYHYNNKEWITLVKINKKYFRPAEVNVLIGDSSKAKIELGWKPKYNLELLIKDMYF